MSTSHSRIRLLTALSLVATLSAACSNGADDEASRASSSQAGASKPANVNWAAVGEVFSRQAEVTGDVHRFAFPRSDLIVKLADLTLKPGFALGSYASFVPAGDGVMVMGDLVLAEPEVTAVMAKLQQGGLEVTALHNHLVGEQPKVMYMHYEGFDRDAVALARNLRTALQASATPLASPSPPAPDQNLGFDPAELNRILGRPGKVAGGLYKVSIARAEGVSMQLGSEAAGGEPGDGDIPLTPAMGVGTVINFQPLDGGPAAITGDFALVGPEVAAVSSTLTARGIAVTAIHTHVTDDDPHLYYLHFFASGVASNLAEGLRAALDLTNSAKG
jgi:uncharacterized protein DUF1259